MPNPLYLVDQDEPTRAEIAMAEIEQEHRDSKWTPFSEPRKSPTFDPDTVLSRSVYTLKVDAPVPLWQRAWRWLLSKIYT